MATFGELPERMRALIEAGFTVDELRGIAADIMFAATLAEGYGTSVRIDAASEVKWTPEKRAAWNALLGDLGGGRVGNDGKGEGE